jgi:hypothetical protein
VAEEQNKEGTEEQNKEGIVKLRMFEVEVLDKMYNDTDIDQDIYDNLHTAMWRILNKASEERIKDLIDAVRPTYDSWITEQQPEKNMTVKDWYIRFLIDTTSMAVSLYIGVLDRCERR